MHLLVQILWLIMYFFEFSLFGTVFFHLSSRIIFQERNSITMTKISFSVSDVPTQVTIAIKTPTCSFLLNIFAVRCQLSIDHFSYYIKLFESIITNHIWQLPAIWFNITAIYALMLLFVSCDACSWWNMIPLCSYMRPNDWWIIIHRASACVLIS